MSSKLLLRNGRAQPSSAMITLETYVNDTNLIIAKADDDKLMMGCVIEASPLVAGGGDFSNTVNSVIKIAPDDAVVQISLIGAPDYDAPARYARNKTHGSPAVTALVHRASTLLESALEIGWHEDEAPLLHRRVIVSLALPVADTSAETQEDIASKHSDFFNNVRRSGFADARVLSGGDVVSTYRWISNLFRPREFVELDELVDMRFQVFGPDQMFDFRDRHVGMLADDVYVATVAVKSFPRKVVPGWMNIATGGVFSDRSASQGGGPRITTPFIFTTTVRVANQRAEGTRVQRAIDSRTSKKAPFTLGREDSEKKLLDLRTLQKQCAAGEDKYVYVSSTAFVFGRTRHQARSAAGIVAGLLDRLEFDAREVGENQAIRFAQTLPLNFSPRLAEQLECEALMSSSGGAALLPLYGDYSGNVPLDADRTGLGLLTRRGQMLSVDIWRSTSPHGVICARTGMGKSVTVQVLIANQLAEGTQVVAVDGSRALRKFAHAAGGTFIEFGGRVGERPSLNPYSLVADDDEFNNEHDMITELALMTAYYKEEVASGARIALSEAVKAAWEQKRNRADFMTVVEALQNIINSAEKSGTVNEITAAAQSLVPRMLAFLDSPSRGDYFRGKCSLEISAHFTLFELAGLGDAHLKTCVLFFITNAIMGRLKLRSGRKLVVMDEAIDSLKTETAASAVDELYRKGRQDRVGIWLVFQQLDQLLQIPAGKLIFSQSYWKWILGQDASEVDELVAKGTLGKFSKDPFYVQLLKSLRLVKGRYTEIMIQSDDGFEVGRLFLDRFTLMLLESEGEARERVFQLMNDGMHVVDAVEQVMGQSKSKRRRWISEFVNELRNVQGLDTKEILTELREVCDEHTI